MVCRLECVLPLCSFMFVRTSVDIQKKFVMYLQYIWRVIYDSVFANERDGSQNKFRLIIGRLVCMAGPLYRLFVTNFQ